MRIKAHEQFGLDLGDEVAAKRYASEFPKLSDGILELDLSHCLIDYNATSILMDVVLAELARASEPRLLIIIFNVKFQERLFLKWLFFGSIRLGLDTGTMTDEQIRIRLVDELRPMKVRLEIKISTDAGENTAYSLGHE